MNLDRVIAIDGPSGSGKSTIAKKISTILNLTYLDTGAMFRGLSVVLGQKDIKEASKIKNFLENINFEYAPTQDVLIRIDGVDLTTKIREHEVSALASFYSSFDEVRSYLKKIQRKIAKEKPSILEGRDIGTVIFPKAALKIFLTADDRVRAKRRLDQLIEKDPANDSKYTIESILQDIKDRDQKDSTRSNAPLVKASDAIEVDTTKMNIDQVIETIIDHYKNKEEIFKA
ncbi:MAG: (d)CMP kinase [Bacteriovoracaceae bacterium]|nr:(d)CMP kinase [Bacteriovoracaceae bacterium]